MATTTNKKPVMNGSQKPTVGGTTAGKSPMGTTAGKPAMGMAAQKKPAVSAAPQKGQAAQKAPMNATTPTPPKKTAPTAKKAEFAKDMTKLDDVAIISDILSTEKNLVKLYGGALTEVSCEKLRKLVNSKMGECAQDQFDAFLYMNARNQYPTEPAPAEKVTQAKQKFNAKCGEMKK